MIDGIRLLTFFFIVVIGFFFMEFISYLMHKYLQHGPLWRLHKDHHKYTKGKLEKNDVFTFFFTVLTMVLLIFGFLDGFDGKFWFGLGIFIYGMGFFLYHDIVFHRRLKIRYKPKSRYIKRVITAHRMHHQKSTATSGISFGFFIVGKKYDLK
jgi:beta-carotene 3-hydroxylase